MSARPCSEHGQIGAGPAICQVQDGWSRESGSYEYSKPAANLTLCQVPRNQQNPSRPQVQRVQSGISKASLISPTSSIEGDDEDSSLECSHLDMERQTLAPRNHTSHYEGEDSRLTSQKELAGWYSYGWAAEVFAICAMGISYSQRQGALANFLQPPFCRLP